MAQQKQVIRFSNVKSEKSFEVWTDLTDDQIRSIEGVSHVSPPGHSNNRIVSYDLRYDPEDIKVELTALAVKVNDESILGNFTQHPRPDSPNPSELYESNWPGHCGMDE